MKNSYKSCSQFIYGAAENSSHRIINYDTENFKILYKIHFKIFATNATV